MADSGDYAIVDVTKGSRSKGKILVLIGDEPTAQEIATELQLRGCNVIIQRVRPRRGPGFGRAPYGGTPATPTTLTKPPTPMTLTKPATPAPAPLTVDSVAS